MGARVGGGLGVIFGTFRPRDDDLSSRCGARDLETESRENRPQLFRARGKITAELKRGRNS